MPGHLVSCYTCEKRFDAEAVQWCGCDSPLRTLACLHCGSCFCSAPSPYKRRFWSAAPSALREQPGRFLLPALHAPAMVSHDEYASSNDQPRVLVVDDEEPMRSLAACFIEQIGYDVATTATPQEALQLTARGRYDVVLTDALMPKMDGRELSRRLKAMHGQRIKVVLMTALYTARRYQAEAWNAFKVDELIAKPLRYDVLRDALQRVAPLRRRSVA